MTTSNLDDGTGWLAGNQGSILVIDKTSIQWLSGDDLKDLSNYEWVEFANTSKFLSDCTWTDDVWTNRQGWKQMIVVHQS